MFWLSTFDVKNIPVKRRSNEHVAEKDKEDDIYIEY
jgi:hypothetical protein